ncbi:MAG: YhcH/YjgK/YiaL family protein [Bacteroidaceae bacterium]|nr:YhcH/YjgK/YiaL family protein [Prevotellaceae bacterium]MDY5632362.1 YhcH/YjgK/YiaL family protein [Bacteroidaceae bacterium]
MIIDKIDNIGLYKELNPRFQLVAEFLQSHSLADMPLGHYEIDGRELFVNIVESDPKTREAARLETHNEMIDIQILLQGDEQHGFCPRSLLASAAYDADNDITFYSEPFDNIMRVFPGQAVIYFPEDAHAPAICESPIRKAIFKVKK